MPRSGSSSTASLTLIALRERPATRRVFYLEVLAPRRVLHRAEGPRAARGRRRSVEPEGPRDASPRRLRSALHLGDSASSSASDSRRDRGRVRGLHGAPLALEWHPDLRARERAREGLHRDRVQEHPLPPGPPRRRRADRAPPRMPEGGQGDPQRRDRQGVRAQQRQFRGADQGGDRGRGRREREADRRRALRRGRGDRPRLLRQDVLPRRGRQGRRRLPAAARPRSTSPARSRSAAGSSTTASGSSPSARSTTSCTCTP